MLDLRGVNADVCELVVHPRTSLRRECRNTKSLLSLPAPLLFFVFDMVLPALTAQWLEGFILLLYWQICVLSPPPPTHTTITPARGRLRPCRVALQLPPNATGLPRVAINHAPRGC